MQAWAVVDQSWPAMNVSPGRKRGYEVAMSTVIVLVLAIGVAWNMPISPIRRTLISTLQPVALATGLDQRWQMYAPNPIRQLEHVEVVVTMADGDVRSWTNPRGDVLIGPFIWYRWQKLKENLVRDPDIRADVAHWVVGELTLPGEKPERVQMTLRTEQLPAPGQPDTGEGATEILYDEDLTQ
jgi:hypothetical protein